MFGMFFSGHGVEVINCYRVFAHPLYSRLHTQKQNGVEKPKLV